MNYVYILIFYLTCQSIWCHVDDAEVAVIIGGINEDQSIVEVEVYSYLNNEKQLCPGTNEEPTIPNFPFPVVGASAIYLPDIGIYVCGGMNVDVDPWESIRDCYMYNPRENMR